MILGRVSSSLDILEVEYKARYEMGGRVKHKVGNNTIAELATSFRI